MPSPHSRTLNPLHFEDMEPHRFEDMIRQLLYDFRSWRRLEPTGRLGGDDGFDVRGLEAVQALEASESESDGEEDPQNPTGLQDRLWLIQCKRERAIGPAKLVKYLDEIAIPERSGLYGIIFVAACDFSKRAHDLFIDWCRKNGVQECYLWGRATIEDMLFQPKNDNLLFAYFGISLAIRRRTLKTELRAITTTKRKLKRLLDKSGCPNVVLRDAEDTEYPFLAATAEETKPSERSNRWRVYRADALTHAGISFVHRQFFAYIDDAGERWDIANSYNNAAMRTYEDPWNGSNHDGTRSVIYEAWDNLPEQNRAWCFVYGVIRYEDVLEVDEIGDDCTEHPHMFVNWKKDKQHPFALRWIKIESIEQFNRRIIIDPDLDKRVAIFQEDFRHEIQLA